MLVASTGCSPLVGQSTESPATPGARPDEDMKPEDTEVWEPEPPIVTAGEDGSAPSDATVLFDGTDLSMWASSAGGPAEWRLEDGAMTVAPGAGGIETRQAFGDVQLHIEWRTPQRVEGDGQGRGNSGVFLMGLYEVQVLDSYENRTYSNGQAGAIYKQHIPLVNVSRAPGEWQSYDIVFRAPRFDGKGLVERPAVFTVLHNAVVIQDHAELKGPTIYRGLPEYEAHSARLPLMLQDHGNPVSYRNIWIRELQPQPDD
ncbi:MAG: DUF1080 domain-containing protein [Rhodothermales bacterium]|nr:DUF1080 domain-containing protein [Rhodothermales bacterium]